MRVIVSQDADAWFNEWKRREATYGKSSVYSLSAKSVWFHFESETIDTRVTWREQQ